MTEKSDPVEVIEYREEIARVKERVISPDGWVLHWGVERAERLLDEIDRLRSALSAAEAAGFVVVRREVLEPFVRAAFALDHYDPEFPDEGTILRASAEWYMAAHDVHGDAELNKPLTAGDLRTLAASLAQQEKP